MRSGIKHALSVPLWDVLRYAKMKLTKGNHFALNNLDRKLAKYLNYRDGFFVELGGNDGFTQSNSYYFEKAKGWKGILIEPAPNLYALCKTFRGGHGNKVFNSACVPFDYTDRFVTLEYGNLLSVSRSLHLDLEDADQHAAKGLDCATDDQKKICFGAQARTLTAIFEEAGAPPVMDLISIDVEGAEMDVMRGIDFGRYAFRYMLVETAIPDKVKAMLAEQGYEFVEPLSFHDYLFHLKDGDATAPAQS